LGWWVGGLVGTLPEVSLIMKLMNGGNDEEIHETEGGGKQQRPSLLNKNKALLVNRVVL